MIKYICKNCNIETDTSVCPNCKERTELKGSDIFWCDHCNVPIFEQKCSVCGNETHRIGSDARLVFPEERLLLEIMLGCPLKYRDSSVWYVSGDHYVIDGKKIDFKSGQTRGMDADVIRGELERWHDENINNAFDDYINRFISCNKPRYDYITNEALDYIRMISSGYDLTEMYVSFSGGKDSTVVSDLVMRALSEPQILHIYGDTTLEFPETKEYVSRFKKAHPKTLVAVSKNKDKDFNQLCEQLGPPSRQMRWCCTIFKTGAIQRKLTSLFKNQKRILTFYGIRRNESNTRSKYDRESDSPKITKQKTVSPIIDWLDFDIWLYLMTTGIDFNKAYQYGYSRVGCWCCPNNSVWSGFLSKIYMPEQYAEFNTILLNFARKIGKPDPEEYIREGGWKARQGGTGMEYSNTSILTYEPCALQENTVNFELQRPIDEPLYELFKPIGYLDFEIGNKRLGEVFVKDKKGKLLLKLQGRKGSKALKVSLLDKSIAGSKSFRTAEDKVKCQITKWQMCMGCLGCESVCKTGAINIVADREGMRSYTINNEKCVRCGECIDHFNGGCYIRKVLTIRRNA